MENLAILGCVSPLHHNNRDRRFYIDPAVETDVPSAAKCPCRLPLEFRSGHLDRLETESSLLRCRHHLEEKRGTLVSIVGQSAIEVVSVESAIQTSHPPSARWEQHFEAPTSNILA